MGQALELISPSHKIGLTGQFYHCANPPPGVDVSFHHALVGGAVCPFGYFSESLESQGLCSFLYITFVSFQSLFTLHDSGACPFPQAPDELHRDLQMATS
jgi:hypothetical protein